MLSGRTYQTRPIKNISSIMEFVYEFKQLISMGKSEEAILLLIENKSLFNYERQKQIELLSGQYNQLRQKYLLGFNQESDDKEKRRIEYAILDIVNGLIGTGTNEKRIGTLKKQTVGKKIYLLIILFAFILTLSLFLLRGFFNVAEEKLVLSHKQFSGLSEFSFTFNNIGTKDAIIDSVKIKKIGNCKGLIMEQSDNLPISPYFVSVENLRIGEERTIVLNKFIIFKNDSRTLKISTRTQKVCEFEITFFHNKKTLPTKLTTNS